MLLLLWFKLHVLLNKLYGTLKQVFKNLSYVYKSLNVVVGLSEETSSCHSNTNTLRKQYTPRLVVSTKYLSNDCFSYVCVSYLFR